MDKVVLSHSSETFGCCQSHPSQDTSIQSTLLPQSTWIEPTCSYNSSSSCPSSPSSSSSSASSHISGFSEAAYSTISSVSSYINGGHTDGSNPHCKMRMGMDMDAFKVKQTMATMEVDDDIDQTPHPTPMPTPVPSSTIPPSSSSKTDAFFLLFTFDAPLSQPSDQAQKKTHTISFPLRPKQRRHSISPSPPLRSMRPILNLEHDDTDVTSSLVEQVDSRISNSPVDGIMSPDSLAPSLSRNPSTSSSTSSASGRSRTEDFFALYSYTATAPPSPAFSSSAALSRQPSTSSQPGSASRTHDFFSLSPTFSSADEHLRQDPSSDLQPESQPASKNLPPLSCFFPSRFSHMHSPQRSRTSASSKELRIDADLGLHDSSTSRRGFVDLDSDGVETDGFNMNGSMRKDDSLLHSPKSPVSPTIASQGHEPEDEQDDEDSHSIRADNGEEADMNEEEEEDIDFLPNIPTRANSLKKVYLRRQQLLQQQQYLPPLPPLPERGAIAMQHAPHLPVPPPLRSLPSTMITNTLANIASNKADGKSSTAPRATSSLLISTSTHHRNPIELRIPVVTEDDDEGENVQPGLIIPLPLYHDYDRDGLTDEGDGGCEVDDHDKWEKLEFVRMIGQGAFSSVWLAKTFPNDVFTQPDTGMQRRKFRNRNAEANTVFDFDGEEVDGMKPYVMRDGRMNGRIPEEGAVFDYYVENGYCFSARKGSETESGFVAVKMIPKSVCSRNDGTRISFIREVEVLKHISHPNIASHYTSFLSSSASISPQYCLVLSYIPGGELLDLVNSDSKYNCMNEAVLRRIAGELIGTVGWLHSIGVVHRDVKLENIILTQDIFTPTHNTTQSSSITLPPPTSPLIKLTDFGLSRFIDPSNPWLTTRCGSEAYAAPELVVARSSQNQQHHSDASSTFPPGGYDARQTDTWACGVVLYTLATRSLPFDSPPHLHSSTSNSSLTSAGASEMNIGRTDGVGPIKYDTHIGTASAMKQRREMLMCIALCQWSWPDSHMASSASSSNHDTFEAINGSRSSFSTPASFVMPNLKHLVSRLLVRSPAERARLRELWDEPWLIGGEGAAHIPKYIQREHEKSRMDQLQ